MGLNQIQQSADAIDTVVGTSIEYNGASAMVEVRSSDSIQWQQFTRDNNVTVKKVGTNPFGEHVYLLQER